jgi:tetratricopeptide (TPR) repeat protein
MSIRGLLVASVCVAVVVAASAFSPARSPEVVRPSDDSLVVAPARPRDPASDRMTLRLRAHPTDLSAARDLATREIEHARTRADPRSLGRAQAALAPWWDLGEPPLEVLLLRATIRQSLHEFDRAESDLDRALALSPQNPQALLTKATIQIVRGRYREARATCERLAPNSPPLVSTACDGAVRSLTGDATGARVSLERALAADTGGASAEARAWAEATLAEIAERAGDLAAASALWEVLLARDPDDAIALAAWADVELARGHPTEVAGRLSRYRDVDALLLRLALAEDALGSADARAHAAILRARFDAARARGDATHTREEARFVLRLERDARRALALAERNFTTQREPWDVRLLLEAADEARAPEAARPAIGWIAESGYVDPTLARLLDRVRGEATP